jgi:undecaprenyl-diphosphatase
LNDTNTEVKKKAKKITLGLIAGILFYLLIVIIFWRIADEIVIEKSTAFDLHISSYITQFVSPAVTRIMLLITVMGSSEFLLPVYTMVCLFLLYKKQWLNCITVITVGLAGKLLLGTVKNIFHRTRPLEPLVLKELGYSFPSGHSFSAFTFFGLMTYLVWRSEISMAWKWLLSLVFFLLAVATAFSRVYLQVHYASDVIAGFCLSILWLTIAIWIIQKIRRPGNNK